MDKISLDTKFSAVCATQLGGPSGLQIWGVVAGGAEKGRLFSTFQKRSSGPWEEWSECSEAPLNLFALTAAQNGKGEVSLWARDDNGVLHCASQTSVGVDNWVWTRNRWNKAFLHMRICACEPSYQGPSGRQLWSYGDSGTLYSTFERERLGGNWTPWAAWDAQPLVDRSQPLIALTAAQVGKGQVSLWALDSNGVLHCRSQIKAGEAWDPWVKGWAPVGPFGRPTPAKFTQICACKEGGSFGGRALWGVAGNGELYWTYETAAMGGGWTKWQKFDGPVDTVNSLTAARGQDQRVVLWALSQDNSLHNTIQTTAGGGWREWEAGGTLWENLSILDVIENTLARKPGNEGVTYLRTSGNKFTLLDTPRLWGLGSKATGRDSKACQTFLDNITDVIGNAKQILDIALLFDTTPGLKISGFPDGKFQDAISRGFKTLSDNKGKPLIRILVGTPLDPDLFRKVPIFMLPPIFAPAFQAWVKTLKPRMQAWLTETIKLYQPVEAMQCPLHMGMNNPGSWNHAKIIAADENRVIAGGHNLWAESYLQRAPVHDVSGLFEGPGASGAHRFCDKLWLGAVHTVHLIGGKFTQTTVPKRVAIVDPIPPKGAVETLSLGRLGQGISADFSISSNASVTARIVALCKAKSIIRISQQSLLGFGPTPYEFYTCLAIVRAVQAGVDVQIVLSNELPNYGGSAEKVHKHLQNLYCADVRQTDDRCKNVPPRENIDDWADLAASRKSLSGPIKGPSGSRTELLAQFNNKLKLATIYYSDNSNTWGPWVKKGTIAAGNHSKVYIIDADCFYVGSDNFYTSLDIEGLQEFGYLVQDENETRNFIAAYWNNLWKYSGTHPLS